LSYPHKNPHKQPAPRIEHIGEPPLTADDWLYILREYRPAGASPFSEALPRGHPAECVTPGGVPAIRLEDRYEYTYRDGEEIVRLRGRGRKSEPRYYSTDDFYPVLDHAAHRLAKDIALGRVPKELNITPTCAVLAGVDRRAAVPLLIELFRGISVEERALKKYRTYLRLACWPYRTDPKTYLDRAARLFLARFPRP